jgi:hypothetical protein
MGEKSTTCHKYGEYSEYLYDHIMQIAEQKHPELKT